MLRKFKNLSLIRMATVCAVLAIAVSFGGALRNTAEASPCPNNSCLYTR